MKKLLTLASAVLIPCLGQGAATFADDNASDAAYNGPGFWQTGDNGGNLFGPWTLSASGTAGHFIGNSALNGSGASGNINVAGESFGMYANAGGLSEAVRGFTVGGPNTSNVLGVGQIFVLRMDTGFIDSGSTVGFGLQNSSGTNRFEVYFKGGSANYFVNNGTEQATSVPFTADGLDISFRQDASNGYELKIGATTYTQADFGVLSGSDISRFRLFNAGAGAGSSKDAFFNSFAVVPEPSRVLLIGLGATALVFRRRRQA